MFPTLESNAAAGYQGLVKIEVLKDACLMGGSKWAYFPVLARLKFALVCEVQCTKEGHLAIKRKFYN